MANMTTQGSEYLESQHADFVQQWTGYNATIPGVPGEWNLYGVIYGMPTVDNDGWGDGKAYKAEPQKCQAVSTANHKGYTELFQLTADGRLILTGFQYDEDTNRQHVVNEMLEGQFYMVLKQSFFSPRLYVLFRDGVLEADRAMWLCDIESPQGRSADPTPYRSFDLNAPWMKEWLGRGLDWH